jgi:hypothetical protein
MTHCQEVTGPNHGSAKVSTPALLQTTWTDPKRSTAAAARVATEAATLTSVRTDGE